MPEDQFDAVRHRPTVDFTGSQAARHVVVNERAGATKFRRRLADQRRLIAQVNHCVIREIALPAWRGDLQHQHVASLRLVYLVETSRREVVLVEAWAVFLLPPQVGALEVWQLQARLARVPVTARGPAVKQSMGEVSAQQRRLEARRLEPLEVTAGPGDNAPGQFMQFATDTVGHARRRRLRDQLQEGRRRRREPARPTCQVSV